MKTHIVSILFSITLIQAASIKNVEIIGGHEAEPGEVPYQVAVFFTTPAGTGVCGGCLLSDQWVISAAHCTMGATEFRLQMGSNLLEGEDPNRVIVVPDNFTVHPEFSPEPLIHDLVLFKISQPVEFNEFLQPIELNDEDDYVNAERVVFSGWGRTSDLADSYSNHLKVLNGSTLDYFDCLLGTRLNVGDTDNVCIKGSSEGFGPCEGDSGGPVVFEGRLVGVISYISIYGCNSNEEAPTAARIVAHLPWIRGVTGL